jgi:hypothetical protein
MPLDNNIYIGSDFTDLEICGSSLYSHMSRICFIKKNPTFLLTGAKKKEGGLPFSQIFEEGYLTYKHLMFRGYIYIVNT